MMRHELIVAENLVREAGRLILKYYHGDYQIDYKNHHEPVTQADKVANEFITRSLRSIYPGDAILAEESKDDLRRVEAHRIWLVDPMDGTKEFIDKVGQFAVMIGLVEDGQPVLGVVYQPTTDTLFLASRGEGAFVVCNGARRPLRVSEVSEIAQMRLVVSRSHRAPLVDAMKKSLGIEKEVSSGSVGLKVGLLAKAKSDLYLHPNTKTKEWDTCAPEIILREAGGIITDLWGESLRYNKENVYNERGFIASNGKVHFEIIEKIKPFLKQIKLD